MNENKFTPTAEEALRLAQEAAGELGHGYVGTEHLLLGLMREDEGMAHTVLTEAGLTDDLLTEMVRKSVGAGLPGGNPAQGLTPRAKHVVEIAMEDSIRGGYAYIGTEHLLAGILRERSPYCMESTPSATLRHWCSTCLPASATRVSFLSPGRSSKWARSSAGHRSLRR